MSLDEHPASGVDWGEPRTRTLTWYSAEVAMQAAAKMTGLQYIEAVRDGLLPPPPMPSTLGIRIIAVSEGQVEIGCTPDESLLNTIGLVHGGTLCTLMDTAMGIATQTTGQVGFAYATVELKVSFLRPLPFDGQEVRVTGQVLKLGRKISFAEAHAYDSQGRLAGHGTSSLAAVSRPAR